MKQTTQIIKIGNSLYTRISAPISKVLGIYEGDFIVANIEKIGENDIERSFRCKACQHRFSTDDEYPSCPVCGDETSLEVIKDEY